MADRKSNHFVPKAHFRPFSSDAKKRSVCLLNIERKLFIPRASIRDQCAKDYFYGTDGHIENLFGKFEGRYASLVRLIQKEEGLSKKTLYALKLFSYLQYSRTEYATIRYKAAITAMQKMAFERSPEQAPDLDLSDEALIQQSLSMFAKTMYILDDLKVCVLKNCTRIDFITSDDPTAFSNKYLSQRHGGVSGNFGISNSGVVMSMPITPR